MIKLIYIYIFRPFHLQIKKLEKREKAELPF
jgi:hypothetical protein